MVVTVTAAEEQSMPWPGTHGQEDSNFHMKRTPIFSMVVSNREFTHMYF